MDVVRRGNLNGTSIQTLFPVGANLNPRGITLDLAAGKVYWGQDIDFESPIGAIKVMNLDGSAPGELMRGLGLVNYLEFVPQPACVADIAPAGGNGVVNIDDLLVVINNWNGGPGNVADIAPPGGNGIVNIDDLLAVINGWGVCPP